jgi:hypothetical protein
MTRLLTAFALILCAVNIYAQSKDQKTTDPQDYLFVWTGDAAHQGNDFLAVIDADASSASYGRLVTSMATDQQTKRVHHTEYSMPASGMLFANDHDAGRTFIFDVRDPQHPKIAPSFTDVAGYMHPHSYLRLPNGHVLAAFQHAHHPESARKTGLTGGLVEIDDQGKVVRSANSADPAFADALLTPYSLVVLPELDRVVSTNSSMHDDDLFSGVTYQVWRLSDLKLLKTLYFDVGENRYSQIAPEEPRLGPDGSILVRGSYHRGALSGAERTRDAWLDRARHCECCQTRGSLATDAERFLRPTLDGVGTQDAAPRGNSRSSGRRSRLLVEVGPRHRRSGAG